MGPFRTQINNHGGKRNAYMTALVCAVLAIPSETAARSPILAASLGGAR